MCSCEEPARFLHIRDVVPPIIQIIPVIAAHSIPAGIETIRHLCISPHPDIVREIAVDDSWKQVTKPGAGIERYDLTGRMYSPISPCRSRIPCFFDVIHNVILFKRCEDLRLDGVRVLLDLESMVPISDVCQFECDSGFVSHSHSIALFRGESVVWNNGRSRLSWFAMHG